MHTRPHAQRDDRNKWLSRKKWGFVANAMELLVLLSSLAYSIAFGFLLPATGLVGVLGFLTVQLALLSSSMLIGIFNDKLSLESARKLNELNYHATDDGAQKARILDQMEYNMRETKQSSFFFFGFGAAMLISTIILMSVTPVGAFLLPFNILLGSTLSLIAAFRGANGLDEVQDSDISIRMLKSNDPNQEGTEMEMTLPSSVAHIQQKLSNQQQSGLRARTGNRAIFTIDDDERLGDELELTELSTQPLLRVRPLAKEPVPQEAADRFADEVARESLCRLS